jgi:hypothetical protein
MRQSLFALLASGLLAGIFSCGGPGADERAAEVEKANPGTNGIRHRVLATLPFQDRPKLLDVSVIDNTMILEGDIALRPENTFDWAAHLPQGQVWLAQLSADRLNLSDFLELGKKHFEDPANLRFEPNGDLPISSALSDNRKKQLWPGATVPYVFDADFPSSLKTRIEQAADHIGKKTNVRFVPRTTETDHLVFILGKGSWSHVGKQGGRQEISIATWCDFGSIVHEMCHALGLWHEQSRFDRDQYVEVIWENIPEADRHNFEKLVDQVQTVGPYDYSSVMHYPGNAYGIRGQTTLKPLKPNVYLGQRRGLSEGDIAALAFLYPGTATTQTAQRAPSPATESQRTTPPRTQPAASVVESGFSVGGQKNYLFKGNRCWRFEGQPTRTASGYPKYVHQEFPGVTWTGLDACTVYAPDKVLMLRGEDCLVFDLKKNQADNGFPKKTKLLYSGLPWSSVDAVLGVPGGKVLFFKGEEVARCDIFSGKLDAGYPKKISDVYPGTWHAPDAVLDRGAQGLFFFKGNEFLQYDPKTRSVAAGFPKPISGNWPGL